MHVQVMLLAAAQALFQTASTVVITIGALAGAQVARTRNSRLHRSLPCISAQSSQPILLRNGWRALADAAVSLLVHCWERPAALSAWGLHSRSLPILSSGALFIGAYTAFAQFYRFAATEVANEAFRPRAISFVLAGGVAAALIGPALATVGTAARTHVRRFLPDRVRDFRARCGSALDAAHSHAGRGRPGQARPLLAIMRQPAYAVALFAAATGSGVMVLAMTATPLAMEHHHHGLSNTTMVIQAACPWNVPAIVLHRSLIERFGVLQIMLTGAALLGGDVLLSLTGTGLVSFASALACLGSAGIFSTLAARRCWQAPIFRRRGTRPGRERPDHICRWSHGIVERRRTAASAWMAVDEPRAPPMAFHDGGCPHVVRACAKTAARFNSLRR